MIKRWKYCLIKNKGKAKNNNNSKQLKKTKFKKKIGKSYKNKFKTVLFVQMWKTKIWNKQQMKNNLLLKTLKWRICKICNKKMIYKEINLLWKMRKLSIKNLNKRKKEKRMGMVGQEQKSRWNQSLLTKNQKIRGNRSKINPKKKNNLKNNPKTSNLSVEVQESKLFFLESKIKRYD